uniref:Uncharacterized protein n=1 Tax=Hyaloperonospora arabidopsidis (strain Emoy2) TaxID=559515 RepID=M4BEN0_HYAAE
MTPPRPAGGAAISRIHSTRLTPIYQFEKALPVLMATFQCCYRDKSVLLMVV